MGVVRTAGHKKGELGAMGVGKTGSKHREGKGNSPRVAGGTKSVHVNESKGIRSRVVET